MAFARPVLLFPGQGSQSPGMGSDLYDSSPAARAVLDEAARAADFDLLGLCFHGPADQLALTEFQQPCVLAVSVAAWAALRERGFGQPIAAIGHSLGEYSAHVAAGSLSLSDAVRLVRRRGAYMQQAVPSGEGAMFALLGTTEVDAASFCEATGGEVWVANLNGGGQVVISGRRADVERAVAVARERGVRRAVALPVSAPFHCTLMEPAARRLAGDIGAVSFARGAFPVITNVEATPNDDPSRIGALLIAQVTGTVRFEQCVRTAVEMGADGFVEPGPGGKLSGMVRRIAADIETRPVGDVAELDAAIAPVNI